MIPLELMIPIKNFLNKNFFVICILIVCVIVAYVSIAMLGRDNPIEQDIEKLVEVETGIHVDFTP